MCTHAHAREQVRFGPDVEWIPNPPTTRRNAEFSAEPVGYKGSDSDCNFDFDYSVDPNRRADFGNAIRRQAAHECRL